MQNTSLGIAGLVGLALLAAPVWAGHHEEAAEAQVEPALIQTDQFDAWMEAASNWGRWGAEDEKGTLNLITPAKRKAAAALVQDGTSVSLAVDLNTEKSAINFSPFEVKLDLHSLESQEAASDHQAVSYHGYAHTHIDGMPHFIHKGKMYNGVPAEVLKPGGAEKLGIENAYEGIFTRGVLVDMAWFYGVDYVTPGKAIMAEDLEAWEAKTGITLGSGDVLLLRTGRWDYTAEKGATALLQATAGLHPSVALWLKERDIAVLGSDAISDVLPSRVEGRPNPLHELVLVGLGMLILDNLDLDGVATAAKERNRWDFLFVGAPLRVPGGTGSPLNPLAIF